MRRANSEQSGKRVWLRRMIASAVVATLLVSLLSFTVFAQNRYVITDGDLVTAHNSFSRDPETVLKEVGIKLGEEDTYTTTYTGGVGKIEHFAEGILEGEADAVLAASVFHFGEMTVRQVKEYMRSQGIPVRL